MEREQVLGQMKEFLRTELFVEMPREQLAESHELIADLGLDSIAIIELANWITKTFEVAVKQTDLAEGHFATLKSVCDMVFARAPLSEAS